MLAADGVTLTLTYNEALKESSVPDASAFTVKATPGGGSEAEVDLASSSPVAVSGSTVVLTLAVPIAHNDTGVKVKYEYPGSGARIEDANGNDAADFTDQNVPNTSTAPRVSVEAVYPDASSNIADAVFRFRRSNTGTTTLTVYYSVTQADDYVEDVASTVEIYAGQTEREHDLNVLYQGNTSGDLTVTVVARTGYAPALAPDNAATVRFKAPASGLPMTIRQARGNWTVDEGETVEVGVTLTIPPGLAEPRDTVSVYLETVDEAAEQGVDFVLDPGPDPIVQAVPGGWRTVAGGGKTQTATFELHSLQDTEVEGNEVTLLILKNRGSQKPYIPTSIYDSSTKVEILDDEVLEVSSVAVTSTPTGGYYGVGDAIEFTVTFNGPVTAEGGTQFAFQLGGWTRQATHTGDERDVEQTFEYTVANTDLDDHDGISWRANALSLNGGTITFPSKESVVPRNVDSLDYDAQSALSDHKVDTMKPALALALATEATLTLTFSEELNTTAPAASVFTVKVDGGAGTNPSSVSISGRDVTLTLASATTPGQTVTVTYANPSTNPIKDLTGKEADALTDEDVLTAPPVEVSVTFGRPSYRVDEGESVDVTVRLSADPERSVTIPLMETVLSGATAGDFSVPASVSFASGETNKTVTFTATQDTENDDGESVRLALGTPLPRAVTAGGLTSTLIAIGDDDEEPVKVSFAAASYAVGEGRSVTVTVQLSATPGRVVTIPLTATPQDGATAPGGVDPPDYAVPTTVTFTSSQTERTVTVTADQDDVDDNGEGVLLSFGTPLPPNVSEGTTTQTTVSIIDDDGPGVSFSAYTLRVVQGRSASYRVTLNTDPGADATVTPALSEAGVTFSPPILTFTANDWNRAQTVTVEATEGSAGQTATITHAVSGYGAVTTAPDVAVTVTVAPAASGGGGGGGFGPALTAPKFIDGFRTSRPLFQNARPGDAVGDPVAATHPEEDDVTYSLSGANASLFTVDEATGQIRLGAVVTLEVGRTYTVNLTATDSSGTGAIIIVAIEVTEGRRDPYDLNGNGSIEKEEVIKAIADYFANIIGKEEVVAVLARYFAR